MSAPRPPAQRPTEALKIAHVAAIIITGVAIAAVLFGRTEWALALIIAVLFVQLFSLEALRHLIATLRENRP